MECVINTERKDTMPKSRRWFFIVFTIAHIQNINEMIMNTILKLRCCSDDEDDDIIVAMYKHESRTIEGEFGKKAVPFFFYENKTTVVATK